MKMTEQEILIHNLQVENKILKDKLVFRNEEIDDLDLQRIARRKKVKAGFAFKDGAINGLKRKLKFHEGGLIHQKLKIQERLIENQSASISNLAAENERLNKIELAYSKVTNHKVGEK